MATETRDFNLICPISRLQCVGKSCACSVYNVRFDNGAYETEYACGLANNDYVGENFCLHRTFWERLEFE